MGGTAVNQWDDIEIADATDGGLWQDSRWNTTRHIFVSHNQRLSTERLGGARKFGRN